MIAIDSPKQVPGFFLPSHRPEFRYQKVSSISLSKRPWGQDGFNMVHNAIKNLSQTGRADSTSFKMKEILIGLGIFGYGNAVVRADNDALRLYEGFQNVLRKILPDELGFQKMEIRDRSEIVLITASGPFLFDAVSGGIAAIMEIAWLIFMFSETENSDSFTVVIDEPENHLHASMQRTLLPRMLDAFPNIQFVIATHSPLIVGSVKDSEVYALRFNDERKVYSESLDLVDKAGTAEEVLREVLGVPVTMPLWVQNSLKSILDSYSGKPLTPSLARRLREDLQEASVEHLLPSAMEHLAEIEEQR